MHVGERGPEIFISDTAGRIVVDARGPKAALMGVGLVIGGIGLAILAGAIGAEMIFRYIERRI